MAIVGLKSGELSEEPLEEEENEDFSSDGRWLMLVGFEGGARPL